MSKKPLLVASLFGPSDRTETWIDLQMKFLHRTTTAFDHAVYLNRVSAEMFPHSIIIEQCELPFKHVKIDQSRALNAIIAFFRRNPDYDNYLILDSDAFPVMEGWLERLLVMMKGVKPNLEKQVAAPVRAENLDTFAHPCVFFIRGEFLQKRSFLRRPNLDFRRPSRWRQPRRYTNLLGVRVGDCASGISPRYAGRHVLLPLMRTNVWNPHPVLSAIYGGLFYHHGAGSRRYPGHRVEKLGLVDHILPSTSIQETEQQLYAALVADPEEWVARLTGQASTYGSPVDGSMLDVSRR